MFRKKDSKNNIAYDAKKSELSVNPSIIPLDLKSPSQKTSNYLSRSFLQMFDQSKSNVIYDIQKKQTRSEKEIEVLYIFLSELKFFHRFFHDLVGDNYQMIRSMLKEVTYEEYPKNTIIFQEYEPSNNKMYVIIQGKVCVYKADKKNTAFGADYEIFNKRLNEKKMHDNQSQKFNAEDIIRQRLQNKTNEMLKSSFGNSPAKTKVDKTKLKNEKNFCNSITKKNTFQFEDNSKAVNSGLARHPRDLFQLILGNKNYFCESSPKDNQSDRVAKSLVAVANKKHNTLYNPDVFAKKTGQESLMKKGRNSLKRQTTENVAETLEHHNLLSNDLEKSESSEKKNNNKSSYKKFDFKMTTPSKPKRQNQVNPKIHQSNGKKTKKSSSDLLYEESEISQSNSVMVDESVYQEEEVAEEQEEIFDDFSESEFENMLVEKFGPIIYMLKTGEMFGEVALLKKNPRNATIIVSEDVKLMTQKKEQFDIIKQFFAKDLQIKKDIIFRCLPKIREVNADNYIRDIQENLNRRLEIKGHILSCQDIIGDEIHFLVSGTCKVQYRLQNDSIIHICEVGSGTIIGEECQFGENTCGYTVIVSSSEAEIFNLSRKFCSKQIPLSSLEYLKDGFEKKDKARMQFIEQMIYQSNVPSMISAVNPEIYIKQNLMRVNLRKSTNKIKTDCQDLSCKQKAEVCENKSNSEIKSMLDKYLSYNKSGKGQRLSINSEFNEKYIDNSIISNNNPNEKFETTFQSDKKPFALNEKPKIELQSKDNTDYLNHSNKMLKSRNSYKNRSKPIQSVIIPPNDLQTDKETFERNNSADKKFAIFDTIAEIDQKQTNLQNDTGYLSQIQNNNESKNLNHLKPSADLDVKYIFNEHLRSPILRGKGPKDVKAFQIDPKKIRADYTEKCKKNRPVLGEVLLRGALNFVNSFEPSYSKEFLGSDTKNSSQLIKNHAYTCLSEKNSNMPFGSTTEQNSIINDKKLLYARKLNLTNIESSQVDLSKDRYITERSQKESDNPSSVDKLKYEFPNQSDFNQTTEMIIYPSEDSAMNGLPTFKHVFPKITKRKAFNEEDLKINSVCIINKDLNQSPTKKNEDNKIGCNLSLFEKSHNELFENSKSLINTYQERTSISDQDYINTKGLDSLSNNKLKNWQTKGNTLKKPLGNKSMSTAQKIQQNKVQYNEDLKEKYSILKKKIDNNDILSPTTTVNTFLQDPNSLLTSFKLKSHSRKTSNCMNDNNLNTTNVKLTPQNLTKEINCNLSNNSKNLNHLEGWFTDRHTIKTTSNQNKKLGIVKFKRKTREKELLNGKGYITSR